MIGTHLAGRYEVLRELGRGAMGVVYHAHDPLLARDVAVKVLSATASGRDAAERFQREARMVARLEHPAIVAVHDIGEHDGSVFFVMPLVRGQNLREALQAGRLTLADMVTIGIQVADALEHSHRAGIVHRDVKPENVLLVHGDDGLRVFITDFGLARAASDRPLTHSGLVVGTLAYLSPEQAAARQVDGRADVYALGCVLYEAVTGQPPFSGEYPAILYRILDERPLPPGALVAGVDAELEALIIACLEKDPADRPERARDVAEALRAVLPRASGGAPLTLTPLARPTEVLRRPPSSPIVGRESELKELAARLTAAQEGECQVVLIAGDAGVGKSRLLSELQRLAERRGFRVLAGRFAGEERAFPYEAFCQAIQTAFQRRLVSPPAAPDLDDLLPELTALFPVLSDLSPARPSGEVRRAPLPEDRTKLFDLLARTFLRAAGGRPLALLLEDLHCADTSVEALQYVVRRLALTPTLIAATYRPSDVDRRHPLSRLVAGLTGDPRFALLTLGPLDRAAHRRFLANLLPQRPVEDELAEALFESTEGNPFFTEELVRSGELSLFASGRGPGVRDMPATIREAVERRVERLGKEDRELLAVAAVLGRRFEARELPPLAGALAAHAPGPRPQEELDDALERLARAGFLEERGDGRGGRFGFTSGLVREVLYASLPRGRRRALHRAHLSELERRYAGRQAQVSGLLLHHAAQADLPAKVAEHGLFHARHALESFGAEEAARAARTVLEYLEEEGTASEIEAEARLVLGKALRLTGAFDEALGRLTEAAAVFERHGPLERACEALTAAAETAWEGRKVEQAASLLARALPLSRSCGDPRGLGRLLSLAATVANLRSAHEEARELESELAALTAPAEGRSDLPRDQRLVVALPAPVSARHPVNAQLLEEWEVLGNVFETLLATDERGGLRPGLCERWDAVEDGRAFLLTLREGARLHDGTPVTAAAVKASIERGVRRAQHELPPAYQAIRGVLELVYGEAAEASGLLTISERTLQVSLLERLPIFPSLLTDLRTAVAGEDAGGQPVGSGPFAVSSFGPESVVLTRVEGGHREPFLAAVEFQTGLASSAIASRFRAGSLDVARDLLPIDLERLRRDRGTRTLLVETPRKNLYFALFHPAAAPWMAEAARALTSVVRTPDLVRGTLGRFAQPAEGLLPPGILGHDPGRRRPRLTLEEARARLTAAGAPRPLRLRAAVHPAFQDRFATLTETLLKLWAALEVSVSVQTTSIDDYVLSWERNEEIDLVLGRWNPDYEDPDAFGGVLFHSRGGLLRRFHASPELDSLLEDGRLLAQPALREKTYRKAESLLLQSGLFLPLFHEVDARLLGPRVVRFPLLSGPPYVDYAQVRKRADAEAPAARHGGGIVTVPIAGELHHLDPTLGSLAFYEEVLPAVFERLTRGREGARVEPWLAASYDSEEGGRRFRFRLRDGVRFHDGRRLSARDVRHSFERLLTNPASPNRDLLLPLHGARELREGRASSLAGLRIDSALELTIELVEPLPFFPALLAFTPLAIVPEGTDRFDGDWRDGCAGTGPFRVSRFTPGRHLSLEANHDYWRPGLPLADGLEFVFGLTPAEILSGFREGLYSLAWDLEPKDVEALRKEPAFAARYREAPSLSTAFLAFNANRGPLESLAARRALAAAVDVPALVARTLGRVAVPARSVVPPGLLGQAPRRREPTGAFRPAISLRLTGILQSVFDGPYAAFCKELLAELASAGIQVEVLPLRAQTRAAIDQSHADVALLRWIGDYPDADTFLDGLFHSERGRAGTLTGTRELDELLARARGETDPVQRHRLYGEAEALVFEKALCLPLFHEQAYRFARPEIEGLDVSFWKPFVAYERLWVKG